MTSEGVDFIKLPYLLNVFGHTGLSKQCKHQTPQNAASDQGLRCLTLDEEKYKVKGVNTYGKYSILNLSNQTLP